MTWKHRSYFLIFSLDLEIFGVAVQRIHQTAKNGAFCEELLSENDFEAVLVNFYYGSNASEAVQKISTRTLGCSKIRNTGMATYGTQNNKSGIRKTEQIIRNGKTRNTISGTGKKVKHGALWTWKLEVFFISENGYLQKSLGISTKLDKYFIIQFIIKLFELVNKTFPN